MTEASIIASRQNPRIVAARRLSDRKHRQQQGRFLVEGVKLLHMALQAGAEPVEVFYCAERLAAPASHVLTALLAAGGEPVAVSLTVMQSLAEREQPEGILATFKLFQQPLPGAWLAADGLVVVLDRLQDPGNLGTLLRTADAVGAVAVVLLEPCVDPFDPKVLRGSMGSLFNVPLVRTGDVHALFAELHRHGWRTVGADAHRGIDWGEGLWAGNVALVLGNEARGLSADVRDHVAAWARLPIAGRAESLNVAVAGGVLMYAWLRAQRERR